jgi:DNA polymerase I
VTIVSGDKDLMQVVSEQVRMLDTMKDKVYGPAEVAERFGGGPDKVVEVQALAGDSSDNIPGVPGIGEKTAVKLIAEFGTVEELLARVDEVKGKMQDKLREFREQALLSKRLVTLKDDLDLGIDYDALATGEPDREALTALFGELEFHKLQQEFFSASQDRNDDYRGVFTEQELDQLIVRLENAPRVSFDTETTSLDPLRADLVGLSFAVQAEQAWYIPVGHHYLGAPEQLGRELVLERLRPLLENPQKLKIAQNAKYDLLVLRRAGVEVRGADFDTMVASYLANPAAKSHGMDSLAADLLGRKTISFSEVAGSGKNQISFAEVEVDKAITYAAEDADITLQLAEKLEPMLKETEQEKLFREVEMPLVGILADMEWQGVRVDPQVLGGSPKRWKKNSPPWKKRFMSWRVVPSISAHPSRSARCCSKSSSCRAAARPKPAGRRMWRCCRISPRSMPLPRASLITAVCPSSRAPTPMPCPS